MYNLIADLALVNYKRQFWRNPIVCDKKLREEEKASANARSQLGHALRRNAGGAFSADLAKKLAQLVKMEKNVMRSLETVAKERMDVAQQLSIWGEGADEDVSDVTDKLGVLLYEIGELEDQYVDRYDQYRITMKSIRNIEASVQPSRDRKLVSSILGAS